MPITYEIDHSRGMVTLRYTGKVGDEDLLEVFTRLYADPRHRVGMAELSDCRAIEELTVTAKGLRRLAEHTSLLLDRAQAPWRVAIVAPRDVDYGMARMYELLREGSPEHVRVFRDLAEAEQWLRQAHPDANALESQ